MSEEITKEKSRKPAVAGRRKEEERRRFLRTAVMGAGVVGFSLLGFLPYSPLARNRLRPPGALEEHAFLSSCIKCGQCVQVCPVEAISLADLADGFGNGAPIIDARAQACDFSCDALQCILACPTGSLSHELAYPREVEMGFARLARPDLCLARKGMGFKGEARGPDFEGLLRYAEVDRWKPIRVSDHPYDLELCDLCVRQCPIEIQRNMCDAGTPPSGDANQCPPRRAISLEPIRDADGVERMTPVIHRGCVGCGVCEMVCPAEPAAIVIDARAPKNPVGMGHRHGEGRGEGREEHELNGEHDRT